MTPRPTGFKAPEWTGPTPVVYRILNAHHVLLYVGFTTNPDARMAYHRSAQLWWWQAASVEFEVCEDEARARAGELAAIHTERPLYNQLGVPLADSFWYQAAYLFREVLAARRQPGLDPVEDADLRTSQYDLEAATHLARGIHPDRLTRNGLLVRFWPESAVSEYGGIRLQMAS